jgi:hypothetical protein
MHDMTRSGLGFLFAALFLLSCSSSKPAAVPEVPNLPDATGPASSGVDGPQSGPATGGTPEAGTPTTPDATAPATPGLDGSQTGSEAGSPVSAEAGTTRVESGQGGQGGASAGSDSGAGGVTGKTEFVSEEPGSSGGAYAGGGSTAAASAALSPSYSSDSTNAPPPAAAPSGRVADVEEADIYKIDGNHLLYFNTYRGFLIFDIADPKNPKQISRLPVFGYPIEMFVAGTTVYALIRDALYLTQVNGKPQFERYNVSQLVAIDISDASNPTVIKTVDIIGQLREGVSRKIEDTIYVVSYIPQSYYYGWSYARSTTPQTEQAWVYSFDVSDPKAPRKVNELQIFEGGSVQFSNNNVSYSKYFSGVAISATSNALMVVENWYVYASSYNTSGGYGCGSYESNQMSVVSLIDVSDPKGTIRRHTKFETSGTVSDQFKMTYVYDDTAKTGTFFGIFARSVWSSSGCSGTSYTQNSIESWDVTDGANPVKLSRLDFGKQNELVRGTAFDVTRQVAYGITAQRVDPLYAISIADRKNLKILSAVDGLSGDMSVFRLISSGNFLLAIGTDTSATCSGFDTGTNRQAASIAVSIIDVRDLTKVRLVQRQCVTVDGSAWGTSSAVTWNLDQAHKMIGMLSDAQANVITVPVYYYTKSAANDWWWYNYQTAVGIMAWDLTKYDDTKDETQQKVITNYGTFVHPNGQVTRTILFTHPVTGRRSMINLSDTHASIADLQDLANPQQLSIIEIAPYYSEIYRFGDYLVEHVQPHASAYQEPHEFRVRKATGGLSDAPVASFTAGQVQRVVKQGTNLLLFGTIYKTTDAGTSYQSTALVYDLSNPESPRRASQVVLPTNTSFPYYYYYCGWSWWGGYWFNSTNNWTTTSRGLVMLSQQYSYANGSYNYSNTLLSLDLSNPDAPTLSSQTIPGTSSTDYYANSASSLVADAVDPSGFYLTYRTKAGEITHDNTVFTQYRNYAQRYQFTASAPVAAEVINLPGPLVNTWKGPAGTRMFLTREQVYTPTATTSGTYTYYSYLSDTKLALLRQVSVGAQPAAELLDGRTFSGNSLSALVREGDTMIVTGRPSNYVTGASWELTSDRFMVFDLSGNTLSLAYDQPTKAYYMRIMGIDKDRAFLNLQGDGIVVVDISKPAAPIGVSFLRTLGYATHLESFGDDVYVASGYFGLEHMSLLDPPNLPQQ